MKNDRPILNQVNIVSRDLAASIDFYRRLSVEIPQESVWQTATGLHHAGARRAKNGGELEFELDSVAFAPVWNAGWVGRDDLSGRVVITFRLPSREAVDDLFKAMTNAGYVGLQTPFDAFWGARYAILQDPDGVAVGLMSPVTNQFRSRPPEI